MMVSQKNSFSRTFGDKVFGKGRWGLVKLLVGIRIAGFRTRDFIFVIGDLKRISLKENWS